MLSRTVFQSAAVFLIVVLSSCAGITPGKESVPTGSTGLLDRATMLALALDVSTRIPDSTNRFFVYTKIMDSYLALENKSEGLELLRRARIIANESRDSDTRIQMLLEICRIALKHQEAAVVIQDLAAVLESIIILKDKALKGSELSSLIQVCFLDVPATSLVLKKAIQQVYVLDDPWLRVYLLSDLSVFYTRSNTGKRSSVLLQQAIPAGSSISNPFLKAEAYSRIAVGFKDEFDLENAARYSKLAIELLQEQEIISLTLSDAGSIKETISRLVDTGFIREASAFVNLIPYAQERLLGQYTIVDGYIKTRQLFLARLAAQRLLNSLDASTDTAQRVRYLARIAVSLYREGFPEAGAYRLEAMQLLFGAHAGNISDAVRSDVALLFGSAGWIVESADVIASIRDAGTLAMLLVDTILDGSSDRGKKTTQLQRVRSLAENAGYMRETILAKAALAAVRDALFADAVGDLLRLNDPYVLASMLVEMAPLAGVLPNKEFAALVQALARRWR